MKIHYRLFNGIRPRLQPHLLGDEDAQIARNVKLWTGALEPFKNTTIAYSHPGLSGATTIYRHGQDRTDENYWFQWAADVDVARGFVASDTQERVFWTGDGVPQTTDASVAYGAQPYPSVEYRLGLPTPGACVISSPVGTGTPTRIVVTYVWVNSYGDTGPPAPASNEIDYYAGQVLTVTTLDAEPVVVPPYLFDKKYLYVSATDATGQAEFRFWKEVSPGTLSTTGLVDFELLGEAVARPSLVAPPDNLFGLGSHPGGFLYGFSGRLFCRSEVFKPYGWPTLYQDPLPDQPVGGATLGSSIVVCTNGRTYLYTGSDPLNLFKVELEGWQPCVAKRSIRRVTAGVVYASPDGLVMVMGNAPLVVVTSDHYTREQWQAFVPKNSWAVVHDDRYYWFWDNGVTTGLLIFEFNGAQVQMVVESTFYSHGGYADHRKDDLYLINRAGNNILKWDSHASDKLGNYVWRSKRIKLDRPQNVGAVKVVAATYPVTFRLYGDDVLIGTYSVASEAPRHLAGARRYRSVHWEIESQSVVTEVAIGSSVLELRRG